MITKPVEQAGFIYIYLSNESNTTQDVYFDDLRITHTKSKILQEDHYYPFGANISALSSSAPLSKPNAYKYQGKEEQTEFDFNTYDFHARMYDPILGRTFQQDPMGELYYSFSPYSWSADNPMKFVDPTEMVIEEGSQKEWDKQKAAVQKRRDKLQNKVDKLNAKAAKKGWSQEKLNNKLGDKKERISSLYGSLQNLHTLENSSQVYALGTIEGNEGGLSLGDDGVISINFGNTANFVHEATHAAQFESNDMGFDKDGATLGQDVFDEISAYKAQYAFDPSSVSGISSSRANSFSSITSDWVFGINGGATYGPNGANTGHSRVDMNSN